VLAATSPHLDLWNCCYAWYGNTPSGFAALSSKFEGAFRRSACVLVTVEGGAGERAFEEGAPPVKAVALRGHLRQLAEAGADEAILVLDRITERSVGAVAEAVELTPRR